MSDVVEKIKQFAKAATAKAGGRKLQQLEVPEEVVELVRGELGLAKDEPIFIDGVPLVAMTERSMLLSTARAYAAARWDVILSATDAEFLFKAVATEELESLITIIVDQHMDLHEFADPVDAMTEEQVHKLKERVREMGLDDSAI